MATYLRGQELILSTGIGLRQATDRRRCLDELVRSRVAGLSIELGRYLPRIPDEMTLHADRIGLPLIVFRKKVRFIDITEDVHALILGSDERRLADLHDLGEALRRLAVLPMAVGKIVAHLGRWLERPVVLIDETGGVTSSGPKDACKVLEGEARAIVRAMGPSRTVDPDRPLDGDGTFVVSRRVGASFPFALIATITDDEARVTSGMALDLASVALSAEVRSRIPEVSPGTLLRDLLVGQRLPIPLLMTSLGRLGLGTTLPSTALVFRAAAPMDEARLASAAESFLQAHGIRALATPWQSDAAGVLFDPPPTPALSETIDPLLSGNWSPGVPPVRMGLSRRRPLGSLPEGLVEAEQALLARSLDPAPASPFYKDLGPWRLLLNLRSDFDLEAFCEDELGRLIKHDRLHGTDFLLTLEVLLESRDLSDAARRLRLRRQSLYGRIRRLSRILGDDFLLPDRRLALHLALRSLRITGTRLTDSPGSRPS